MADKTQETQLPESPISVNFRTKSPNGFEHQITLRKGVTPDDFSDLMTLLADKEKILLAKGYTPVVPTPRGGFPPKQVDYVPNRACPADGARLVRSTTKDGRKLIKCENNKWNFQLKRAEGCPFTEWEQPAYPYTQGGDF